MFLCFLFSSTHRGTARLLGYPDSNMGVYIMSKIALNAATRAIQNIVDQDTKKSGIIVSSVQTTSFNEALKQSLRTTN